MTKPTKYANAHYERAIEEFKNMIVAAIPNNMRILRMESPWDLFDIEGLKCDNLGLSLYQAQLALYRAKAEFKSGK